ncbi:hypothetical protein D3C87_1682120 [compost metagenome]
MSVGSIASKALTDNKQLMASAAVFETGRIANKKLTDLLSKQLPPPLNMLVGTPIGQLIVANLVKIAAEQVRPGDDLVERLTNGMIVSSYTELFQSFNIEGVIDDLLGDKAVKAALGKQAKAEKAAEE